MILHCTAFDMYNKKCDFHQKQDLEKFFFFMSDFTAYISSGLARHFSLIPKHEFMYVYI